MKVGPEEDGVSARPMAWQTIRRILVHSYIVGQQLARLHVCTLLRPTFVEWLSRKYPWIGSNAR